MTVFVYRSSIDKGSTQVKLLTPPSNVQEKGGTQDKSLTSPSDVQKKDGTENKSLAPPSNIQEKGGTQVKSSTSLNNVQEKDGTQVKSWTPPSNVQGYRGNLSNDETGFTGNDSVPRILVWTKTWNRWYPPLDKLVKGEILYNECKAPCYITNDRNYLEKSDAVLFYSCDLQGSDLPAYRTTAQKWIYWSWEPPPICGTSVLKQFGKIFNWSMTYRKDSDVWVPFGEIRTTTRGYNRSVLFNSWKNKKKTAVWPVSNCDTFGKRELYVRELADYLPVDIYGKCGPNTCPKSRECSVQFEKDYYFWFAFENSLCVDYVTEKLFTALNYSIIPVVFGGVDYAQIAPPGSFIDALSFDTPRHLADHLNKTARNFTLYERYFEWKTRYTPQTAAFSDYCALCNSLHNPMFRLKTVYSNISQWWEQLSACRSWNHKK